MSAAKTVQELNRELAQKLIAEAKINPQAPYMGKWVGIVNGQVVAVAGDCDDLYNQLMQVEPDLSKCSALEVGRDHDKVIYIW